MASTKRHSQQYYILYSTHRDAFPKRAEGICEVMAGT